MTRYDCEEFLDEMKADPDLGTESVEGYAIKIRNFYSYYNDRGTFEVNPMKLAMDDYDFGDPGDDFKREISVDEMREFVQSIHHPLVLAIVVLFLKTGIRVGELCNIDMRDVYIDDPRVMELWPEHRTELEGKPDSIYIERRGVMHIGAVVNGENRTESNKRIRSTVIPIDSDLSKEALDRQVESMLENAPSVEEADAFREGLDQIARRYRDDHQKTVEEVKDEAWTAKTKNAARSVPFDWCPRAEIAIERFFDHDDYTEWPYSMSAIRRRVDKSLRLADGLDESTTKPHGLRATSASFLAGKGLTAPALQAMYGWSQISTAQAYIASSPDNTQTQLQKLG